MFTPPPLWRPLDPIITPFSDVMAPFGAGNNTTPTSGSWITANQAIFMPLYLPEPFTVSKAFWCNGATVGTDSIDIGVYRMTDMALGRLDLIRSTGAVLSAGTVNVVQEASVWKVARKALGATGFSTDAATYDDIPRSYKAGRLYLVAVENSHGSSASAVSAITDQGTTLTLATPVERKTVQFNSSLNRISVWSFVPTADFTATLRIAFGGTTQTGCCFSIDEFSGVDTTTNDGIVQSVSGTGSSATALATLAAFGSANNSTYGAQGHASTAASTAGSGFTQLGAVTASTPAQAIQTECRVDNDTTVDSTFTSAAWGMIGAEIKADTTSAFVIPASMPGAPNIYMGMAMSGTTATIFRTNQSQLMVNGYLNASSSFPLPSSITAVAITNAIAPLAGFSSRSLIG